VPGSINCRWCGRYGGGVGVEVSRVCVGCWSLETYGALSVRTPRTVRQLTSPPAAMICNKISIVYLSIVRCHRAFGQSIMLDQSMMVPSNHISIDICLYIDIDIHLCILLLTPQTSLRNKDSSSISLSICTSGSRHSSLRSCQSLSNGYPTGTSMFTAYERR
jgi:hypothetical protein